MQQPSPHLINTFRCNQRWDDMMPTSTGRFCDSCRKEVRDFAGMPPELVLQVLQENNGSVCGRIEVKKVDYRPELHQPIQLQILQHPARWYKMAAAAVTTVLMLIAGKASGQDSPPHKGSVDFFGTFVPGEGATDTVNHIKGSYVLKGKVTDEATGETIPFANVIVFQKGKQIAGAAADFDGVYEVRLDSAKVKGTAVNVEVSYVGYTKKTITGVTIPAVKPRVVNVKLSGGAYLIGCESDEVIYTMGFFISEPLPEPGTIKKEEIRKRPSRDIGEMLQTQPGIIGQ